LEEAKLVTKLRVEINASLSINISQARAKGPPAKRYAMIRAVHALAIPQVLITAAGFGQAANLPSSTCNQEDPQIGEAAA
jgi:hypothetical protein